MLWKFQSCKQIKKRWRDLIETLIKLERLKSFQIKKLIE